MSCARARNVWFYNGLTHELLGGVQQNGSITNENFFEMLTSILLIVDTPITIYSRATGQPILLNDEPLQKGHYDIFCAGGDIKLTDETPVLRTCSRSQSGQETSFTAGVRARDRRCVLSGLVNVAPDLDDWTGFEAAHIFPLEKEDIWNEENFSRWITKATTGYSTPINSIQNGILLTAAMHDAFLKYLVSVNPDDAYKIIYFGYDHFDVDGRALDPVCRKENDPNRVADELLRWHFRQSVLANMKGIGEPIWEHDFPPGTDMIKEIVQGPKPAERMELELCSRLRGFRGCQH
ncbi:hypothetical protein Aspvir_000835 [Aspergillus viridinutans]|uniref:HNH nuclease domain-containing protein n=1 Tax=Aspergillus viridinutans TaxID=75553 RepID=A0A9P3BSC4_ASPVI|nr:uncharacterized protein Aspvir_000835 [Aspergillus viridinutans]GIJ98715.1 hypothetical protein Aspvir_000835 [Aspergillus viridinutans]